MAATISVRLINSASDDPVSNLELPATTTLRKLLELYNIDANSMNVQVRVGGEVVQHDLDDELEDGVRVTVSPEKIKGA